MNVLKKLSAKEVMLKVIGVVMLLMLALPSCSFATSNKAQLTVTQTFENLSATRIDNTFTYQLKPEQPSYPVPLDGTGSDLDEYSFTISGNDSITIEFNGFTQPGIYRYHLSQLVASGRPGYSYDEQVYTIDAYVNSSLSVNLIALNAAGDKVLLVKFANRYSLNPTDPNLMIDPLIVKTVTGNPATASTFYFTLQAADSSYPMPEGSSNGKKTIQVTGSGQAEFGCWSYSQAGVYTYTIIEENSGVKGYSYDQSSYTITDTVTEANGELVLTRVVTNNSYKQVSSCSFINNYTADNSSKQTNPDNSKPGGNTNKPKPGPNTGDNLNIRLLFTLLFTGLVLTTTASIYLLKVGRSSKQRHA